MKPKVAVHLRGIKLSIFIYKVELVQSCLQDPDFATVLPSPAEVLPLLEQLKALNAETMQRNYSRIALRDEFFHKLKQMYSNQCMAVNGLAQGDLSLLEKSGFDLAKSATNPGIAPAPAILYVKPGMEKWHVALRFSNVPSRQFYEVNVTDAQGVDHFYACRNTKLSITDLEPNQEVRIRVRAFNSDGEGLYSDSTSYFIPQGVRSHNTNRAL